ncbi:GNAT family N-acetyltransferase [Rhodocytophaga aerolata]|uniref:GNAT family N-acetyltransferase n=1 Tax=Rhodocytophaga aerolata TaxID=455078 RepID=A0ABT8RE86_9BACT|nr:GNAT family N-acetyltransferase [Rhodocytophaga aerolata]MDO1450408.1 GNAT family N-acetyltransferase [Rhodocytophaga aerolata]
MVVTSPQSKQDFDRYYQLRWEILRKPWGQPKGSEVTTEEDSCIHAMVLADSGEILGVARLQFNSPQTAQVRFVAVAQQAQGKGVGKLLMEYLEKVAKEKGATEVVLDARENAVPFYKKINYQVTEKTYLLFNEIQHYRMVKKLL